MERERLQTHIMPLPSQYSLAPTAHWGIKPRFPAPPALFCPLLSFLSLVPIHLLGTQLRIFLVGTYDRAGASSPISNSLRREM